MTDRAYARISLDTAASGSISKQRSRLSRFADGEPEWYVDESVSGSKIAFADRPAGARLLADLHKGDRVLVTKIDRAARNVRDLLGLVERIEAAGCSIVFVDQNIDTAGPMGRFLLTLLGAIAELEAGIIAERRRESLEAFKAEGRHALGRAPYGLRSVPNPNGRGLVLRPDPVKGPHVRALVAQILDGVPQYVLAPETGLSQGAFSRLLRNERLAGVLHRTESGEVRLDPDMAIFSLSEWADLQEHLGRPEKAWTKAEGIGGALACGVCGGRLYLNAAANPTYKCRRNLHGPDDPSASVSRARADAYVEKDFLDSFGHLPVVEEVTTSASAARDEAVALARLNLDAIKAAQDAADDDDEEERLFDAYRVAKKALRDAEALPSETVTAFRDTGQTFAQAWAASSWEARTDLLRRVGPWLVSPGRNLPIDVKIRRAETEDYLSGSV